MLRRRLRMFRKNRVLPPGATELYCIASTGSQYIDTGRKVGDKDEIFIFAIPYETNPGACFGWADSVANGCFFNSKLYINGEEYDIEYSEQVLWPNIDFKNSVCDTRYGEVSFNKDLTFDENGRSWENMCLFACNRNGTIDFGKWAILEYKHRNEHGGLIQHLVPALDETGVPCMCDLVSGRYFYNANKDSNTDFDYEI